MESIEIFAHEHSMGQQKNQALTLPCMRTKAIHQQSADSKGLPVLNLKTARLANINNVWFFYRAPENPHNFLNYMYNVCTLF